MIIVTGGTETNGKSGVLEAMTPVAAGVGAE
jgi:hypothetical protein